MAVQSKGVCHDAARPVAGVGRIVEGWWLLESGRGEGSRERGICFLDVPLVGHGEALLREDNTVKASALRELTAEELDQKYKELTEELFNLRFQLATSQMENVGRMRIVRRDIARVKTIQRERQLSPSKQD